MKQWQNHDCIVDVEQTTYYGICIVKHSLVNEPGWTFAGCAFTFATVTNI